MLESLKITMLGLGGLGAPALKLMYLLEDQIFPHQIREIELNVFEPDIVELSNLNRQILYSPKDLGMHKIDVCSELFEQTHSRINFHGHTIRLRTEAFNEHLSDSHIILDYTDDPQCKYELQKFALKKGKINIYSAAQGQKGLCLTISAGGPCLECIFGEMTTRSLEELNSSCQSAGIVGYVAGMTALTSIDHLKNAIGFLCSIEQLDKRLSVINDAVRKVSFMSNNCCKKTEDKSYLCHDLSKHSCPETFMYAKLALQENSTTQQKTVLCFSTETELQKVSNSLKQEGYEIEFSPSSQLSIIVSPR